MVPKQALGAILLLVGKTGGNFTELLRMFASISKSGYSARKSWKFDDNVIGCLRTRIEVVWEIKVNRLHALGFSVL
jgi:hypothetical protein